MATIQKPVYGTSAFATPLVTSVTAAAGGAGQLINYNGPVAAAFTLTNLSSHCGVEYKYGSDPWKFLGKKIGVRIEGNPTGLLVRLVNDGSSSVSVDLTAEGVSSVGGVSLSASPTSSGIRAVLVGDSNTHRNYAINNVSALSRSNGVATVTFTADPYWLFPGCPVQIVGVPEDFRGNQIITGGSNSVYTYDNPGPDVASATLGANPSVANLAAFSDQGWFVWGNAFGGSKFDIVGISASTGRKTDEMLSRIGEVSGIQAETAFVMGGTNDVMTGVSASAIIANLDAIYKQLRASGKYVFALTIMPLGSAVWTAARTAVILQVNQWIKNYCRSNTGMRCIDIFAALVDPVATNKGQAAANMIQTDGLHLTQKGAGTAGEVFNAVTSDYPRIDFRTTSNADNYGTDASNANVQDAAPWAATGGNPLAPVTGTMGAGANCQRQGSATVAVSSPARADGVGFDWKADVTSTAAGDGARFNSSVIALSRVSAGATIQSDASVAITGAAGVFRSFNHYLLFSVSGKDAVLHGMVNASNSTGSDCYQKDWSGVVRTPAVRLPIAPAAASGSTGLYTRSDLFATASGSISMSVGRAQTLVTT